MVQRSERAGQVERICLSFACRNRWPIREHICGSEFVGIRAKEITVGWRASRGCYGVCASFGKDTAVILLAQVEQGEMG